MTVGMTLFTQVSKLLFITEWYVNVWKFLTSAKKQCLPVTGCIYNNYYQSLGTYITINLVINKLINVSK